MQNRFFEFEPEATVNIRVAQAAGGVYSTVRDLYSFSRALFTGKLLPPEFVGISARIFLPIRHSADQDGRF